MQHTVQKILLPRHCLGCGDSAAVLLELFSVYAYGTSQDGALMLLLTVMLYGAALASVKMYT